MHTKVSAFTPYIVSDNEIYANLMSFMGQLSVQNVQTGLLDGYMTMESAFRTRVLQPIPFH